MGWNVNIEAGRTLLQEGEDSQSMYLVLEGELAVSRKEGDRDVVLGYVKAGELVGELSFLDKKPRSATVKALTDCKLFQIPQKTYDEIFEDQPRWLGAFVKTLAARIRKADERIKI